MIDSNISGQLKEAANKSANDLVNSYVDNEDLILENITQIKGIKSEFYCDDLQKAIEVSKFLNIYSDFTSVFMLPNRNEEHLIHYYPPEDRRFIKRSISFPEKYLNGYIPQASDIIPAYTTYTDINTKKYQMTLHLS